VVRWVRIEGVHHCHIRAERQDLVWARVPNMRTLHVGLRVSDLDRSLAFYTAVGYTVAGTVEDTAFGSLTMLRLPGDHFVTIELVYDPTKGNSSAEARVAISPIPYSAGYAAGQEVASAERPVIRPGGIGRAAYGVVRARG